jgi:hypothetical protein
VARTPNDTPTPIPTFTPCGRFDDTTDIELLGGTEDIDVEVVLMLGRSELCQFNCIIGAAIVYCDMVVTDPVIGTVRNVKPSLLPD